MLQNSFAFIRSLCFGLKKNEVSPREVSKGTEKKYYFDCSACKHEIFVCPKEVVAGSWCSYCTNHKRCISESCTFCFKNSFALDEKSKCWSKKNLEQPRQLAKNDTNYYLFDCPNCLHEISKTLQSITLGSCCYYCSNKQRWENENCQFCFNHSFASHEKAQFWSILNEETPRQVAKSSHVCYLFDCSKCLRVFRMSLRGINAGNWCPFCPFKTQTLIVEWLKSWYGNGNIVTEKVFPGLVGETGRSLRFDCCVETPHNFIVEVDGRQHFEQVWNWGSPEQNKKMDILKMKFAISQGYKIVRISQEDCWNNQTKWKDNLQKTLDNLKEDVTYLANDPMLYQQHKESMNE